MGLAPTAIPVVVLSTTLAAGLLAGCSLTREFDRLRPAEDGWRFRPRFLRTIGGPLRDEGLGCAIATDGSIRVVGSTNNGAEAEGLGLIDPLDGPAVTDALWIDYESDGTPVAHYRLEATTASGFQHVAVVGGDDYLAGFVGGDVDLGDQTAINLEGQDALIMRRRANQTMWSALGRGQGASLSSSIDSMDGRVVVTGRVGRTLEGALDEIDFEGCEPGSSQSGRDGYLASFDAADGSCQWIEYVETGGSDLLRRGEISSAPLRPIVAVGRTRGQPLDAPGDHDLWMGSYSGQGAVRWSLNPEAPAGGMEMRDVASTASLLCGVGVISSPIEIDPGEPLDPGNQSGALVLCRFLDGERSWTSLLTASGPARLDGAGIDGPLLIAGGTFGGTLELGNDELVATGPRTGALIAYDVNTGAHIASASFGGGGNVTVSDVAAGSGSVCVTGFFDGELASSDDDARSSVEGSTDAFLVVFDLTPPS